MSLVMRFVLRSMLFSLPVIAYAVGVDRLNQNVSLLPPQTESNLALIPQDSTYDLLLLGTSQARTFARPGYYERCNALLNRSWVDLGLGVNGGGRPAKYSLNYFFSRGNRVDTVLYFVSPWVFYTAQSNELHPMTRTEPFRFDFLWSLLGENEVTKLELRQYASQLFHPKWKNGCVWGQKSEHLHLSSLGEIDPAVQAHARGFLEEAVAEGGFETYKVLIHELDSICKANSAELIFVDAPILMDSIPGASSVSHEISRTGRLHLSVPYSILDPALFYDHIHLNRKGAELYLTEFLLPTLNAHALQ